MYCNKGVFKERGHFRLSTPLLNMRAEQELVKIGREVATKFVVWQRLSVKSCDIEYVVGAAHPCGYMAFQKNR